MNRDYKRLRDEQVSSIILALEQVQDNATRLNALGNLTAIYGEMTYLVETYIAVDPEEDRNWTYIVRPRQGTPPPHHARPRVLCVFTFLTAHAAD